MSPRMPCSITDGEQYDDREPELEDGDTGYDRLRQQDVDESWHALLDNIRLTANRRYEMICYKCGKDKYKIMALKNGCGPICAGCWYIDDRRYDMENILDAHVRECARSRRNARGKARWLRLRCAAQAGHVLPDPRNQEQRDLGTELVCRRRWAMHYIEVMEELVGGEL